MAVFQQHFLTTCICRTDRHASVNLVNDTKPGRDL